MTASILTVDFRNVREHRQHKSGKLRDKIPSNERPRTAEGKLLTPKQIRARMRRKAKRGDLISDQEMAYLYKKPVDEWDTEELAHGRPRDALGGFKGPKPKWISQAIHEESMDRYTAVIKAGMNVTTVDALKVVTNLLNDDERDEKGKPIVSASTKLDAAKFLIEHVIGKPKQHIQSDVSVKLQAILGTVMVNPTEALMDSASGGQGYTLGHLPGVTMDMGEADPDAIDAEFVEGGW